MTPDRHLGAAWIDKCKPDVIITESTYATTIRDSKRCLAVSRPFFWCRFGGNSLTTAKLTRRAPPLVGVILARCRERNFLQKVHSCVEKGGKILIPVFALGRAQVPPAPPPCPLLPLIPLEGYFHGLHIDAP